MGDAERLVAEHQRALEEHEAACMAAGNGQADPEWRAKYERVWAATDALRALFARALATPAPDATEAPRDGR